MRRAKAASYQYGFDDTAFVIADGDSVVVDVNDCKIRGRALSVAQDFGRGRRSPARAWLRQSTVLYEADDPRRLRLVTAGGPSTTSTT
ncbi:MAG: hypothetical protein R2695_05625 [Acidimicrobiales bacterium]